MGEVALRDEDTLYQLWRDVQDEVQRQEAEESLFRAILPHAKAIVWQPLHEQNDSLALNITGDAVRGLHKFNGKSKFSTWVHAIAKNQVRQEKRARSRYRKVFNESVELPEIADSSGVPAQNPL